MALLKLSGNEETTGRVYIVRLAPVSGTVLGFERYTVIFVGSLEISSGVGESIKFPADNRTFDPHTLSSTPYRLCSLASYDNSYGGRMTRRSILAFS